ncbi:hypothetical protein ACF0H5_014398 [Mactra antiquata]
MEENDYNEISMPETEIDSVIPMSPESQGNQCFQTYSSVHFCIKQITSTLRTRIL